MKRIIIAAFLLISVFMFVSCADKDEPEDSLPVLEGVTLTTELEYYAEGTVRVLAFWENNTDYRISYGESWHLEKYDAKKDRWTLIHKGESVGFNDIAYGLLPEWYKKYTYNITTYDENIKEGLYRIKTRCFTDSEGEAAVKYGITAEFTVTRDESLLKKSELDYDDLANSKEIYIGTDYYDFSKTYEKSKAFPVHVYKNNTTYDSTIVINGDEYYEVAEGNGKWGLVMCLYYAEGDNKYLLYTYSRDDESGNHKSYIGIFDLIAKKEIYRSKAYDEYDIVINYRREKDTLYEISLNNYFEASFMRHEEDEAGGVSQSSAPGEIGYFKYENGAFNFYE